MRIGLAGVLVLIAAGAAPAAAAGASMLELRLGNRRVEGLPLVWAGDHAVLLARDGGLINFSPREASDFHKTADRFRSLPIPELRAALLRELGPGYEVSATRHYLVAHPQGQHGQWSQRFEDLYRALVHYFTVRGLPLAEPEFPLIGIVCKSREEFLRYSVQQGTPAARGVLGYYAAKSNRIVLYDQSNGTGRAEDWRRNAATVIHEATHQTAFNTGIHNRYCPPPVWVAEGLATMFEAPGVYDSALHPRLAERINRGRCEQFRRLVAPHRPENLAELLASDERFQSDPAAAYAQAWAWTFFLVETQPRKYAEYLSRTARHPSFTVPSPAQRAADFAAVFSRDRRVLEAHFLRFMRDLSASAP